MCDVHFIIYLFILAALGHWLSLAVASGGCCLLRCVGFSSWWFLVFRSTGSRHVASSSCSTRAQ